jgi:hypothetical protein
MLSEMDELRTARETFECDLNFSSDLEEIGLFTHADARSRGLAKH